MRVRVFVRVRVLVRVLVRVRDTNGEQRGSRSPICNDAWCLPYLHQHGDEYEYEDEYAHAHDHVGACRAAYAYKIELRTLARLRPGALSPSGSMTLSSRTSASPRRSMLT